MSSPPSLSAPRTHAIVAFSGGGGSTLGLRRAGLASTIGIEFDQSAYNVATAAGLPTVLADITELDPFQFFKEYVAGKFDNNPEVYDYLLGQFSPPCTAWSAAGKGIGRKFDQPLILDLLHEVSLMTYEAAQDAFPALYEALKVQCRDQRSWLILEPLRWILALDFDYLSFEQVKECFGVWELYATILERWGWSTWVGKISAETFGAAQTRLRAYLLASKHGTLTAPVATHSKYHSHNPAKLDEGVEKWVSMREALSFGLTERPSFTVTSGGAATGGAEVFARGARDGIARARARTEAGVTAMRSQYGVGGDPRKHMERPLDEPAPTVTSKAGRNRWVS